MTNRIIIGVAMFLAFVVIAIADIFWLNFIIFGVILGFAFLESLKLYGLEDKNLLFIALVFYAILPFLSGVEGIFKLVSLNIVVILAVLAYVKSENFNIIAPFLYPLIPLFMIFSLYQNFGMAVLFWLIFTIISSDTGAFFVGKKIGEIKFSPSSPNKTLEGVVGGVILGSILGSIFALIFTENIGVVTIVFGSILTSIFGVFGDLFESYLKRRVGLKDSGEILGAHGGVLDRMDGYLFGVVAMFLVLV